MRVAVAGLAFETNSFSAGLTNLADFRRQVFVHDADVLRVGGGKDELAGAMTVAEKAGVELVPLFYSRATSGPVVDDEAYEYLKRQIIDGISAIAGDIDGVYLRLHGAMVSSSCEDVEGDILTSVRDIVGDRIPIAGSYDLHCHFTRRMAEATPIISGFQTCPHVDFFTTGQRAMRMLVATMTGAAQPTLGYRKVPMISSAEAHDTTDGPLLPVFDRLHEIEKEPGVLDATLFLTQPWLDVSELGWSALVITDDNPALAQAYADELAEMLWQSRELTLVTKTPIADALDVIRHSAADARPFVFSDGADSPSAGCRGDGPSLLREVLSHPVDDTVLVTITDAPAALACHTAGVGASVSLDLGGTRTPALFTPVSVTGVITTLFDGRYQSIYPPMPIDAGRCAVLRSGDIHIVITEHPCSMLDPQLYRRAGLDPTTAKVVQVKSAGGYRAHYGPIAHALVDIDTRGPADHDLTRLPFTAIGRPLWPFDRDFDKP